MRPNRMSADLAADVAAGWAQPVADAWAIAALEFLERSRDVASEAVWSSWQKPRFLPAAHGVMSAEIAASDLRQIDNRSREVASEAVVDAAGGGTSTSRREDTPAPHSGSAV
jgi:F420-dependent methylenetetrahydromethanopterin dehydrogenase